ncbi:MAG: GNAT family N-acetyltransferase [Clostridiaceae bacterium]|nr:GNAT family N-acetyltransferase [Clostridiaceae bacterium]
MLEVLDIINNSQVRQDWEKLLTASGLKYDPPYSVIYGIYEEGQLLATGARDQNRLKCIAIHPDHQGGPLFNQLLSGLISDAYEAGQERLFLYTQPQAVEAFGHLGFRSLASTSEGISFMERGQPDFDDYLAVLVQQVQAYEALHGPPQGPVESIVMNANPFTLGHRALVEDALTRAKRLHLFVLSEDSSLVPADIRLRLVQEGTADLAGILIHPSDHYIISRASFPSYFLKKITEATEVQASLDALLFRDRIAPALGISQRTVGDEPFDQVTYLYNRCLKEIFHGKLGLTSLPRLASQDGMAISASRVRGLLMAGDRKLIRSLVPETTYRFFKSAQGKRLVDSWLAD